MRRRTAGAGPPCTARWDEVQCVPGDRVFAPPADAQVQVIVPTRPKGDAQRVSIFLVNTTPCAENEHPMRTSMCSNRRFARGLWMTPRSSQRTTCRSSLPADPEEATLSAFLYRHTRSLSRGHLRSAGPA